MMMVSIVEDDESSAKQLEEYLDRYSASSGQKFCVTVYSDAETFLVNYRTDCDIVFMDIELPDLNGMEAARKLRERDAIVSLIFVTNMSQFAVKGYSVGAFDFIVKPVSYFGFATMLDRVLPLLKSKGDVELTVRTAKGIKRICVSRISYIEVRSHKLIYHTDGEDVEGWGSLNDMEEKLEAAHFARGNSFYLVNLKYVTAIDGNDVTVGGESLPISRTKKKEFMRRLNEYLGDR